jgi:hypothetical protein
MLIRVPRAAAGRARLHAGVIALEGGTCAMHPTPELPYQFFVKGIFPKRRTFKFLARNAEDLERWVTKIRSLTGDQGSSDEKSATKPGMFPPPPKTFKLLSDDNSAPPDVNWT